MRRKFLSHLLFLTVALFVIGCSVESTPSVPTSTLAPIEETPIEEATVNPTDTPEPTPTSAVEEPPTPIPSDTPTPVSTAATTVSIDLAPVQAEVVEGQFFQFASTTTEEDAGITWFTSNPNIAEVSSGGLVSAKSVGTTTVTATLGKISDSATVTVIHGPVALIEIGSGTGLNLESTLRDAAGHVLHDDTVEWSSTNPGIVEVNTQTGELSIKQIGVATIVAASGGVTSRVNVNVNPEPVASVTISPPQSAIDQGETVQLTAILQNESGQLLTNRGVNWTSDNNDVLEINDVGQATGKSAGQATVTATVEGISASALMTVNLPPPNYTLMHSESPDRSDPAPLQSVVTFSDMHIFVSPSDQVDRVAFYVNDPAGSKAPFKTELAAPYDLLGTLSDGSAQSLKAGKTHPGRYTITARVQQNDGTTVAVSSTFTIVPVPVTSVKISPDSVTVETGQTSALTAKVLDVLGNPVLHRPVVWKSSDRTIVQVDDEGTLTGVAEGLTTISAEVDGVSASIPVSVTLPQIDFTLLFNSQTDPQSELVNPANFQELNGAKAFSEIAIFVGPAESVQTVSFTVDGDSSTSVLTRPELGPTLAINASSEGLGDGSHSVVAIVESTDGETHTLGAVFEVIPPPAASITLFREFISETGEFTLEAITEAEISVGLDLAIGVEVADVTGRVVSGRMIDWSSSDSNIVEIIEFGTIPSSNNISRNGSAQGELCTIDAVPAAVDVLLLGVAEGQATITATVEGVSASITVTVLPPPA